MSSQCEKCKGVIIPKLNKAIASSITAAVLWCVVYDRDRHCPYLPDHHHTPREVMIPPEFSNTSTLATSSGEYWEHRSIINRYDDPEIDGNIIQIFNFDNK